MRDPWREMTRFAARDGDTPETAAARFVRTKWPARVSWAWADWAAGTFRVGTMQELYRVEADVGKDGPCWRILFVL